MSNPRKRILLSAESSLLNTGYGTMTAEIAARLHARGYAVAELASYLSEDDQRIGQIPWKVYPVRPAQSNQEAMQRYNADPYNQFGKALFERAVLDFKADCVAGWRDGWYEQHITVSPLRRFFRFLYMPTCDSVPQKAEWVGQFRTADALFSYTDWAREVLEGYGLDVVASTPPGVNHDHFRPLDRHALRAECRIPGDALVVGFVARNQPRKRFPELARAFAHYLQTCPEDLSKRTFLYLHTAWPDLGWDIPGLLQEFGISSRALFTYLCRNCKSLVPSLWSDAVRPCPNCGRMDAVLPSTNAGLSHQDMAKVYNLMDVYTQFANCLRPSTPILSQRGWVPISEVCVGDSVWTHRGRWNRVIRKFVHESGDRPLHVRMRASCHDMVITSEHPVLALKKSAFDPKGGTKSARHRAGKFLFKKWPLPEPSFIPAGELEVGDLLVTPIDDTVVQTVSLDLSRYASERDDVSETHIKVKHGLTYARRITVDAEFCRFMGLFAANGSAHARPSQHRVSVCSNTSKVAAKQLCLSVLSRLAGHIVSIDSYVGRQAEDVETYGCLLARMFTSEFYTEKVKSLPQWVMQLPCDLQEEVIRGFFMGDGCDVREKSLASATTTSSHLARQLETMLQRCRVQYGCCLRRKNDKRRKPIYCFEIYSDVLKGELSSKTNGSSMFYDGNRMYRPIRSIVAADYSDEVMNIEVENDNSYLTNCGVVHNSEGLGMSLPEAASCGVPVMAVDYSGMACVVRKLGGTPLKVAAFYREPELGLDKAIPCEQDFAEKLQQFLRKPEPVRRMLGGRAREAAIQHYSWDRLVDLWCDAIERMPPANPYDEPPTYHVSQPLQEGLSNADFVRQGLIRVAGRPDLVDSWYAQRLLRELNWGATLTGSPHWLRDDSWMGRHQEVREVNRDVLMRVFQNLNQERNFWEQERTR